MINRVKQDKRHDVLWISKREQIVVTFELKYQQAVLLYVGPYGVMYNMR